MNLHKELSDLIDRIGMRISKHISVDGIWIGCIDASNGPNVLKGAAEALSILQTYDPIKYSWVCRDIKAVWFTGAATALGTYKHSLSLIELDENYCSEAAPEVIASLIVHEAAHARLIQFGYGEAIRARIERICINQEISFASRLPNGDPIVQWAKGRLDAATDAFYSDVAWRDRRRERELDIGRKLGIPLWFLRFLQRRADREHLHLKVLD